MCHVRATRKGIFPEKHSKSGVFPRFSRFFRATLNGFFTDAAETYPGTWFASMSEGILSKFSGTGLAVVYSTIYNGLYMIPEIVVTAVVGAALGAVPFIAKRVRGDDLA